MISDQTVAQILCDWKQAILISTSDNSLPAVIDLMIGL